MFQLEWTFKEGSLTSVSTSLKLKRTDVSFVTSRVVAPIELIGPGVCRMESYVSEYFFGIRVAFPHFKKYLEKFCRLKEPLKMSKIGNLFFIKIEDEVERIGVLDGCPILIFGRVFIVQQWTLDLESQRNRIDIVLVWVKLRDLPRELWEDEDGLSFAANLVRDPRSMDETTARRM